MDVIWHVLGEGKVGFVYEPREYREKEERRRKNMEGERERERD